MTLIGFNLPPSPNDPVFGDGGKLKPMRVTKKKDNRLDELIEEINLLRLAQDLQPAPNQLLSTESFGDGDEPKPMKVSKKKKEKDETVTRKLKGDKKKKDENESN